MKVASCFMSTKVTFQLLNRGHVNYYWLATHLPDVKLTMTIPAVY